MMAVRFLRPRVSTIGLTVVVVVLGYLIPPWAWYAEPINAPDDAPPTFLPANPAPPTPETSIVTETAQPQTVTITPSDTTETETQTPERTDTVTLTETTTQTVEPFPLPAPQGGESPGEPKPFPW